MMVDFAKLNEAYLLADEKRKKQIIQKFWIAEKKSICYSCARVDKCNISKECGSVICCIFYLNKVLCGDVVV